MYDENIKSIKLQINNNSLKKLTSNLPNSGRVYERGKMLYNDSDWENIQFRLRGESFFHHDKNLPSLRLNLGKERSINMMGHINLTKPEDPYQISNYLSDYLADEIGIMNQKHELVRLEINKFNFGLYHLHHRRDENLIRANLRMPGPIFNLKKNNNIPNWGTRDFEIKGETKIYDNTDLLENLINIINNQNPNKDSFESLWKIMNKEKFAKHFAYLNLIGSVHSDYGHNFMMYFDPTLGKFEPIIDDPLGFGAMTMPRTVSRILNKNEDPDFKIPLYERSMPLLNFMLKDPVFINLKNQYLFSFLNKYDAQKQINLVENIYQATENLILNDYKKRAVFETITGFKSIPLSNSDFNKYKKKLNNWIKKRSDYLYNELTDNFVEVDIHSHNNEFILKLNYKSNTNILFDTTKLRNNLFINNSDKKYIKSNNDNSQIELLPVLAKKYNNFYPWAKDAAKEFVYEASTNNIYFKITNIDFINLKEILLKSFYNNLTNEKIEIFINKNNKPNILKEFEKINSKQIKFRDVTLEGEVYLKDDLIIKEEETLIIKPGTKIYIAEGVSIISYGKIFMMGEEGNRIKISSLKKDSPWGVIALIGKSTNNSKIFNTDIMSGSQKKYNNIYFKGMISIHWSDKINILNSTFRNNHEGDDILNIVHSNSIIKNSKFFNCFMDCVDFDYSNSKIYNSSFTNAGNDTLDFMESDSKIYSSYISFAKDKGISVGENSNILVFRSEFLENNIANAAKDGSKINILLTKFIRNNIIFSSYAKNYQYNSGGYIDSYYSLFSDNKDLIEIDKSSEINIFNSNFDNENHYEHNLSKNVNFLNKDINYYQKIKIENFFYKTIQDSFIKSINPNSSNLIK